MTSLHGIALNVCTELNYDRLINPCGLSDRGITSISHETGRRMSVAHVKPILTRALERTFGIHFEHVQPAMAKVS